jgi:hypothetical protein
MERHAAKKMFLEEKKKPELSPNEEKFSINCVVITNEGQNLYHDHKVPTGWNKVIQKDKDSVPVVYFIREKDNLAFYSRPDIRLYFDSIGESELTPENFDFSPIVSLPPPVPTNPLPATNRSQNNDTLLHQLLASPPSGPNSSVQKNVLPLKQESGASSTSSKAGNQTLLSLLGMPRTAEPSPDIGSILQTSMHRSQTIQESTQYSGNRESTNTILKQMLASTTTSSTIVPKSTFINIPKESSHQTTSVPFIPERQKAHPVQNGVGMEKILRGLLASSTLTSPIVSHPTVPLEKKTIALDTSTRLKTAMHLQNPTLIIRNDLSANSATRMQPNIHQDVAKVVFAEPIIPQKNPESHKRQSQQIIDQNRITSSTFLTDNAQSTISSEMMQITSVTGSYNPWFEEGSSREIMEIQTAPVQGRKHEVRNNVRRSAPHTDVITLDEGDDDIVVLDPKPVRRTLQLQQQEMKQIPVQEFLANESNFSPNLSNFFPSNVIIKCFGGSTYTIYDERIPVGWQKWIQGSNSFFLASFVSPEGELIPSQPAMQKYLSYYPKYLKFSSELLDFEVKFLSKSAKILFKKASEVETGNIVDTEQQNRGPKRRKVQPSSTNQCSTIQGSTFESQPDSLSDNGKENSVLQSSSRNVRSGSFPEVIDLENDDDFIRISQNPNSDVTLKQLLMREIDSEIKIKNNVF